MMLFSLAQSTAAFLLGVLVSVMLSGVQNKHHCRRKILVICLVLLTAQLLSFLCFGHQATKQLYPLIVHLPLWILMILLLKTPLLQTAVSILIAYMYCQIPRWIASGGLLLPETHWLYCILYLPAAVVFLFLMWRYLSPSLGQVIGYSRRTCRLMGLLPLLYYLFDYVTTVYTQLLISGNMAAVQFMPSVISMAYLFFVFQYHSEQEKRVRLSRERDFLALQLHQSGTAISAIQQTQEKTMQYRHDMRHHFNLLQSLAAENNIEKIRQYLNNAQQDIENLTPVRYCGIEIVNLLLSYYASLAKKQSVEFSAAVALPSHLPHSDTELCSLLSNGLENAICAASRVEQPDKRTVSVHIGLHCDNLLIQIENTFTGTLQWQDGLPCTDQSSHGFGTRSIRAIARSHGGDAIFRTRNDRFQLRIMLPSCADPDSAE